MTAIAPIPPGSSPISRTPVVSPRIITIASGKGGVGKTWVSSTLSHSLAFRDRKVLLFDGDLGLANVDVQLGLSPSHDLGSVVDGHVPLQKAVTPFQGGPAAHGGFDVLAGRSGSGALSMLTKGELADIARTLHSISAHYDHLVIDLAAGIDSAVMTLSSLSDLTLVVATDEPTSLTDAYAFIKVMRLRDPEADIRIVVNMADSIGSGRRTYETLANACRTFLKTEPPLAGIIHRDGKVKDSIRRQAAILSTYPQAQAAKNIEALVSDIAPETRK